MKKQLPLYILLVFLLAINVFFLVNFLNDSKPPHHKGPKGPNVFLAEELNFNDQQRDEFNALEQSHRERMRTISDAIRNHKRSLFDNISNENTDNKFIDSITSEIGELEKQKDEEVFNHLRAVYHICDENQKAEFDDIVQESLHRGPPPPPRR